MDKYQPKYRYPVSRLRLVRTLIRFALGLEAFAILGAFVWYGFPEVFSAIITESQLRLFFAISLVIAIGAFASAALLYRATFGTWT